MMGILAGEKVSQKLGPKSQKLISETPGKSQELVSETAGESQKLPRHRSRKLRAQVSETPAESQKLRWPSPVPERILTPVNAARGRKRLSD